MKGKNIFKLGVLSTILSVLLVVPALAQTGQTNEALGKELKDYKAQTIKELKVAPDKEKALMAVEDKYSVQRGEIVDGQKKAMDGLLAALAAPTPDEAKIQAAVAVYIDAQSKMFNSFKSQLDEELALLSPVQQGKYLIAMEKWRQQCMPKVCIPVRSTQREGAMAKSEVLREIIEEIRQEEKSRVAFPFWGNWGNWRNWRNWHNWGNWFNWWT